MANLYVTTGLEHPDDVVGSGMRQLGDRRPTSTYGRVWVVRPVWISAWGRRALSYASRSSNQTQSLVSIAEIRDIILSANILRTRLAKRSPPPRWQLAYRHWSE